MMLVASGVALLSSRRGRSHRSSNVLEEHATPRLAASVAQSAANWNDLTEDASRLTDAQIARTIPVVAVMECSARSCNRSTGRLSPRRRHSSSTMTAARSSCSHRRRRPAT